MSEDAIKDEIRRSTDSAIQALTMLVREIQVENRKHRAEESTAKKQHIELMLKEVGEKIEVVVNGKIDSANKKLDMLIRRTEPVIRQYEDSQGFWNTVKRNRDNITILSTLIAGVGVLFIYLIKVFQ